MRDRTSPPEGEGGFFSRLAFPLVVIGMNSIAAYLIAHLWEEFVLNTFRIHVGMRMLNAFGLALEPFVLGVLTMTTYWLILYWMFRKRIFIRI